MKLLLNADKRYGTVAKSSWSIASGLPPSSIPNSNSAIFAAVKRSISTAILFLSFVLALCNAGHATLARTATADPRVEPSGRYVAHIFTYPHTELEIYPGTSSIASNSTSRASASWGFITHAEYTGHHLPHWINGYQYQLTGLSCKEYLSHIYPSHNFW